MRRRKVGSSATFGSSVVAASRSSDDRRSCISSPHHTKKMRHQQLRISRVISTVEANERSIGRQSLKFQRKRMHQSCKGRLTNSARSTQQCMQSTWWIQHCRLCLLNRNLQPLIGAYQRLKTGHNRPNLHRSSNSSWFPRLLHLKRSWQFRTHTLPTCISIAFTRRNYTCGGHFYSEQNGTARDTFDHPFLSEQIQITAGIGTIYPSLLCNVFRTEA